jgi:rRNA processing protein Gar1
LFETVIAAAFVTSCQINAMAVLAKTRINGALVDILALVRRSYFLISRWTDAHEGAD